jgi:hypothetical protein
MANTQKPVGAGGYYSGANPIPTIQEFIENLDSSKNLRDKEIEETQKKPKGETQEVAQQQQPTTNDAHAPQLVAKRHQKLVTDPVTGKEVVIEHAKKDVVNDVRNPKLSVPNANLGKETVRQISAIISTLTEKDRHDRGHPVRGGVSVQPGHHGTTRPG